MAAELQLDPGALDGLLRFLVGLRLLDATSPELYALTPLGRRLGRDELGPLAAFLGAPDQWDPWSRLAEGLQGGASPFERTFGVDLYTYLAEHPEAAKRYDAAIDVFTHKEAEALSRAYDFGGAKRVLDVGGGRGALLAALLERWPHLEGILFDLPHVVDAARGALVDRFGSRVRADGGNFREALPTGCDHVLIKYVLHNWPDDTCIALLERARAAVAPGGHVLVIEAVAAPDGRLDTAAHLDLEMRVLTGGRERRKPELRRLFQAAGLSTVRFEPLTASAWLAVLRP
ncbi:MAG: methyltransferase domain-containing protein [Planctomycetaceae bacterium]|nr:methyltransferase domain-containing protein [Planctomycetaceae bacterium]